MRPRALLAAAALAAAALSAAAGEPAPRMTRSEYTGTVDGVSLRLSIVMDVSRTDARALRSDALYSVDGRHYLVKTDIDAREPSRRIELLTGRREERLEVTGDATDPVLTLAQLREGFRRVRIGEAELLLAMDDVGALTVRRQLDRAIEGAFRPQAVADLRLVRRVLVRCSLWIGLGGDALAVLFGDGRGDGGCPGVFASVPPDPERDRAFAFLDPTLAERLARPAVLLPRKEPK